MKYLIKFNTHEYEISSFLKELLKLTEKHVIEYKTLETVCTFECVFIEFYNPKQIEIFKEQFKTQISKKYIRQIIHLNF